MSEQMTQIAFSGTEEQEKALLEVIESLKDNKGKLMPIFYVT